MDKTKILAWLHAAGIRAVKTVAQTAVATIGTAAMQECIRRAKEYGVSFCTVNHASHYGFGGFYAMQAAAEGMIGFNICNSPALVAPFGGATAMLGTNPMPVAVPVNSPDTPPASPEEAGAAVEEELPPPQAVRPKAMTAASASAAIRFLMMLFLSSLPCSVR